MKPPPFQYFAPTSIDEALALMAEHGYDAKALAGGQSLIPTMNLQAKLGTSKNAIKIQKNNIRYN